jgi:hypothetical protein
MTRLSITALTDRLPLPRDPHARARWAKIAGIASFTFFLVKGLAWAALAITAGAMVL